MNIVVCVKQVMDTEALIELGEYRGTYATHRSVW